MNKKILVSIVILLLFLVSLGAGVYLVRQRQEIRKKAAPATVLSLIPSTLSKNPGEEFSLEVNVDTGENQISATDIVLSFESTKLTVINVTQGTFLSTVLVSSQISPGSVRFSYANQPAKQGLGALATVLFKIQGDVPPQTSAVVSFSSLTQVAGVGEIGDVLVNTNPATVTILGTQPTSTPTPIPTPTSPPGGTGGGTIPTSTPTPKPTATPTPSTVSGATSTPTPVAVLPTTGGSKLTLFFPILGLTILIVGLGFGLFLPR